MSRRRFIRHWCRSVSARRKPLEAALLRLYLKDVSTARAIGAGGSGQCRGPSETGLGAGISVHPASAVPGVQDGKCTEHPAAIQTVKGENLAAAAGF